MILQTTVMIDTKEKGVDFSAIENVLMALKYAIPNLYINNTWSEVNPQKEAKQAEHIGKLKPFGKRRLTVKQKLRLIQDRAKELGGTHHGRYPHVNGTKWWACGKIAAWIQAAEEAGVEYLVLPNPRWVTCDSSFKVIGLTLKGTRKTAKISS